MTDNMMHLSDIYDGYVIPMKDNYRIEFSLQQDGKYRAKLFNYNTEVYRFSDIDSDEQLNTAVKYLPSLIPCKEAIKCEQIRDNVNHPSHYNNGSIECIDAMLSAFGEEETLHFCKLNAFKYIWRAENKNGLEDLKKASWYLNKYIDICNTSKR